MTAVEDKLDGDRNQIDWHRDIHESSSTRTLNEPDEELHRNAAPGSGEAPFANLIGHNCIRARRNGMGPDSGAVSDALDAGGNQGDGTDTRLRSNCSCS